MAKQKDQSIKKHNFLQRCHDVSYIASTMLIIIMFILELDMSALFYRKQKMR